MIVSTIERFRIEDPLHGGVPGVVIRPRSERPLPLCLFLYGGGGSAETLAAIQPLLDGWWSSGALSPLLIATPDVGPWSFYLDDPARGLGWESFIAERFVPCVEARFGAARSTRGMLGLSMGGYGALKLAFARPLQFTAVAAVSPMVEPAFEANACPVRNRFHYPPEVPQALLGPARDALLYQRDQPASRARANADALRDSALAIYIDAAGDDALNAHDGAEFLHRVLWQHDIAHEYRLRRDADHVGCDLPERMLDALRWAAGYLVPTAPAPRADVDQLRQQLSAARAEAQTRDPSVARRYGALRVT